MFGDKTDDTSNDQQTYADNGGQSDQPTLNAPVVGNDPTPDPGGGPQLPEVQADSQPQGAPATDTDAGDYMADDNNAQDASGSDNQVSAPADEPEQHEEPAASEETHDETASDTSGAAPAGGSDDLLDIKQQALQQLTPLVDHLDQSPKEEFRTTMMMIQATDNQDLIKKAFDAAQKIQDDRERAQAFLDIINEINYFTQNPQK